MQTALKTKFLPWTEVPSTRREKVRKEEEKVKKEKVKKEKVKKEKVKKAQIEKAQHKKEQNKKYVKRCVSVGVCCFSKCTEKYVDKPIEINEQEKNNSNYIVRTRFLKWDRRAKYCHSHWWTMSAYNNTLAMTRFNKWVIKNENTLYMNHNGDMYNAKGVFIRNMKTPLSNSGSKYECRDTHTCGELKDQYYQETLDELVEEYNPNNTSDHDDCLGGDGGMYGDEDGDEIDIEEGDNIVELEEADRCRELIDDFMDKL